MCPQIVVAMPTLRLGGAKLCSQEEKLPRSVNDLVAPLRILTCLPARGAWHTWVVPDPLSFCFHTLLAMTDRSWRTPGTPTFYDLALPVWRTMRRSCKCVWARGFHSTSLMAPGPGACSGCFGNEPAEKEGFLHDATPLFPNDWHFARPQFVHPALTLSVSTWTIRRHVHHGTLAADVTSKWTVWNMRCDKLRAHGDFSTCEWPTRIKILLLCIISSFFRSASFTASSSLRRSAAWSFNLHGKLRYFARGMLSGVDRTMNICRWRTGSQAQCSL